MRPVGQCDFSLHKQPSRRRPPLMNTAWLGAKAVVEGLHILSRPCPISFSWPTWPISIAPTSHPTRRSNRATSDVLEREVSEAIATFQDLRAGAAAPTSRPTRRTNRAASDVLESEVSEAVVTTHGRLLGTCDTEPDVSALAGTPQLRPVLSTPLSDGDTQTATCL